MVYLLEFSGYVGDPDRPRARAKYYLGYCHDHCFNRRMREHAAGRGAKLVAAAIEQGLTFRCVLTIANGTRTLERRLKSWKSHKAVLRRYGRGHYLT